MFSRQKKKEEEAARQEAAREEELTLEAVREHEEAQWNYVTNSYDSGVTWEYCWLARRRYFTTVLNRLDEVFLHTVTGSNQLLSFPVNAEEARSQDENWAITFAMLGKAGWEVCSVTHSRFPSGTSEGLFDDSRAKSTGEDSIERAYFKRRIAS